MDSTNFLEYCRSSQAKMLHCLEEAVKIESPTNSQADVDRQAQFFAGQFRAIGGRVEVLAHLRAGSCVRAEFWGDKRAAKPVLLLGHLDTVWDVGTLARMPFRIAGGRAYGPGIYDMKSGIVIGLWALRALRELNVTPSGPIRFFLNSDEETSSIAFRKELFAEARRARAVLVLEPAAAGGALKTSRKGVGEFRITVHGRSAHAGVDPRAGVNAISELVKQLRRVEKFARPSRGLTVSVGMIEGGTRPNVVPEKASARIDIRIPRLSDQEVIEARFRSLKPIHPEARLAVEGGINRPPMERAMAKDLYHLARDMGRRMGMDLSEASTGGGSDGNFTASLGIPTLDGLGAVGEGAHSLHENIVIRELPLRAALLAALLAAL